MVGSDDVVARVTAAAGPAGREEVPRLLSLMVPGAALLWLEGSSAFFGGARPIDVLAIDGPAPVLEALDAFEQGVFT